jgi:hypothetical protein
VFDTEPLNINAIERFKRKPAQRTTTTAACRAISDGCCFLSSMLKKFQDAARSRRELLPLRRSIPGVPPPEDCHRLETDCGSFNEKGSSTSGSPTGQDLIAKNRKPDAIVNYHIDH